MTGPYHDNNNVPPRPTEPYVPGQPVDPISPAAHGGAHAADKPVDEGYLQYQQEERSLGEITSDLMDNASTLIRQEVALAKAEVKQSVTRAGSGVGMLVGAGIAGLLALIALTLMLWWAIGVALGSPQEPSLGISGLIVTAIWAIVAGILAMVGKGQLDKIKGLEKTTDTIGKIPNAATGNEEKNR